MIIGLLTKMVYLQTETIIDKSHYGHASYRSKIDILHPMLTDMDIHNSFVPCHEIPPLSGALEMEVAIHVLILQTIFIVVEDAASCLLMNMF